MRILLTGHKGFLGRHIYKALDLNDTHEVHGFDCDSDYDVFDDLYRKLVSDGNRYDLVIHNGALSNSQVTDNLLWQLNYKASTKIADYCKQTQKKLIFISSAAAIDPDIPYGWSKHCAEYYLSQVIASSNLCILRPFNIWDYDEEGKESPSIVYKILAGKLEKAYEGCLRDFVHVTNVATAIQHVVNEWEPGVFSIGTAQPTNIATLVNQLYQNGNKSKHPKPLIVNECPIKERLVASPEDLLPNWKATPLENYFEELQHYLIEDDEG
ncbi:MAG: NAD(P)-dependent oxidoreductase [Candidatus Poribacteria bacterium]|nr:NAD(P)-dependent oxidoreductase [Candidatus Poribacteria bacterium]